MTQNPLIDFGTQSPKTPGLKPALATALASLEVQLDQELTRYRRTRASSMAQNKARTGNYISSQSQQLPLISMTSGITQPSVTEIKAKVSPVPIPVNSQDSPTPTTTKTDVPPLSVTGNSQINPAPTIIKTEELDNREVSTTAESTKTPTPAPPNSSSIVPATVKAKNNENLLQADNTPKQPNDYLESSEALLRSLTEEQSQANKPSDSSGSLLSPLGIGSILLLLLASLTLGYVIFNPKTSQQFNLGKLFNNNSSPSSENLPEVNSTTQSQSQPAITAIPKYPDLTTKEFPEVRDPNDVVGLKPKAQSTYNIVVPNPATTQNPVNPQAVFPNPIVTQNPTYPTTTTPVLPEQPLPSLNSPPTPTAKTTPQINETPLQPSGEIKRAADGFYHVVIDNQDDRTFASARQLIPDAYLSKDKKFIYMGALKTPEEVQRQLRFLESKGIKAKVQQP